MGIRIIEEPDIELTRPQYDNYVREYDRMREASPGIQPPALEWFIRHEMIRASQGAKGPLS